MVIISSRWRPEHIERRDPDTGFYESVNHVQDEIDRATQRLLLARPKDGGWFARWLKRANEPYTAESYQKDAMTAADTEIDFYER